ncbi:MAG: hypothetical protein EOP50_06755 [Sphingobacteriales bacterium]|nr:MAG: hypothetical protein EOP50_06755 [Sphingobacteriales bacterium]
MPAFDPRIDAYIEKAAPFAQPILHHLRDIVHRHCPDVQETVKWSAPHFEYLGRLQFNLAAFKEHCIFGFWLAPLMTDPSGLLHFADKGSMGSLGRIASLKDLPPDKVLKDLIKQSMRLTEEGVRPKKKEVKQAIELEIPDDFLAVLKQHKRAQEAFKNFPPSHRNEYITWITEAKREETRAKRITEAIGMLSEGKSRHWKYQK